MNRLPIDNYEVMARAPLPVLQEEGPSIPFWSLAWFPRRCDAPRRKRPLRPMTMVEVPGVEVPGVEVPGKAR